MIFNKSNLSILFFAITAFCQAQDNQVTSPDKKISVTIKNGEELSYSVLFNGKPVIQESALGFEFKAEPAMNKGFSVISKQERIINETWKPVVKSKHAEVLNNCIEIQLILKEKAGLMRQMELTFRAYNDGVAFRTKLYRSEKNGHRQITKELTTFTIPGNPKAWVVEYGKYSTSNESEFFERPLSYVSDKTIAGMPFLMDYGDKCWVAITEADIDNIRHSISELMANKMSLQQNWFHFPVKKKQV